MTEGADSQSPKICLFKENLNSLLTSPTSHSRFPDDSRFRCRMMKASIREAGVGPLALINACAADSDAPVSRFPTNLPYVGMLIGYVNVPSSFTTGISWNTGTCCSSFTTGTKGISWNTGTSCSSFTTGIKGISWNTGTCSSGIKGISSNTGTCSSSFTTGIKGISWNTGTSSSCVLLGSSLRNGEMARRI
eukprot:Protomagalhaensia_wolfi_Nauph_80__1312@NODE_1784_length_1340_cov_107_313605_g1066_i1_p2_GENE_NODE_1784_length_1340_cov_107_313605_g1066_i1NODE_1784_length_1340_cov_107_313605_g1066_i1_p2_ORF_typecomplete_len191_score25_89DUF4236/PF14020_6/3_8DUF4236/PF14020_6/87DUF4236/PF14020_6/89DUF4236/PF14020_6/1e02_NODE_1784_length_1340_cov_107_313605_g1066_i1216788